MNNLFTSLYLRIWPWFLIWFISFLLYVIYTIITIIIATQSDPSAGAVLAFFPFFIPVLMIKPFICVFISMVIYKLGYWLIK